MTVGLWVEGVIVQFKLEEPCHRAIVRCSGKHEIILADIIDGTVYRESRASLDKKYQAGQLSFLAESRDFGELKFVDLTEAEQRETNRRYQYISQLCQQGISKVTPKNISAVVANVAAALGETPPHWQTIRNWYGSYACAGYKMRGLYPKHRFKGRRQPQIDNRVLGLIEQEANRFYKSSQPSMSSIVRNVEEKVMAHNLDHPDDPLNPPAFLTVQKRVLGASYQKKQQTRQGRRALEVELAASESGIKTSRVLERVEIDHTQLDLHVLHDDLHTLLGRPYITVLIDHYSHMVQGFQISFENPSFASVCMACMNAFLPKDQLLADLDCQSDWPAHGVPSLLVTDNGNEFWGTNIISVAEEVGSIFQYCPVRKGRYKSRVERFFGIVNSLVLDDLPGVVRKPGQCGEDYDARQAARMTFTEFKRYFVTWLTEVYHNLPIEGLGMSPNELWLDSEQALPIPVEDENELTPILMATVNRELGKGGIRLFSLDYNSTILKDLYRGNGPGTVTIKYNPFDIGYILVLDNKHNLYLKVYCEQHSYAAGLSLYEHKQIKIAARQQQRSKLDNLELQKSKVKLSRQRDALHARNKRRKTQTTVAKAARSEKIGVKPINIAANSSQPSVSSSPAADEGLLNLDGWSIDL